MHSSNAGYHGLSRAAGTINCHHGGKPCPAQPPDRIQTESRVFPDAGAHTRFGESMITAVTPPMKSESGFLNTRHDTESGDTSAALPAGRKKSMEDRSPESNSARVAVSKLVCNGQGRTTGVITVTKPPQTLPVMSVFCV